MQYDHVLKKFNFDLLIRRVGGGGVCRQNICNHVAAFCDSLYFFMQLDLVLKMLNFDLFDPIPMVEGGGVSESVAKLFATMLLNS